MEKFKQLFKGNIKDLRSFFDQTCKGEDFDNAFMNRKRLRIKQYIDSYDYMYKLYRSADGKYVLFERDFLELSQSVRHICSSHKNLP